jgi:putative restriction endonuclease
MFAVALTDQYWFEYLRKNEFSGVVNFWTPTPWGIRKLTRGSNFYFFRKTPVRKVAGGGKFVRYSEMTIKQAWEKYEAGNGCENFNDLKGKIKEYLGNTLTANLMSHKIGCIELIDCRFLGNPRFFKPSKFDVDFPSNIQKFKYIYIEDQFEEYISSHGKPQ